MAQRHRTRAALRFDPRLLALLALLAPLVLHTAPVAAQAYPSKTVRLIVPVPPGGLQDSFARAMAQEVSKLWAQPVVVDNRAGASGIIGAELAAKAPADGYTILMMDNAALLTNHLLRPNMAYDAFRDFTPVIGLVAAANVLLVLPDFPAKNLQEFLAHARAKPGGLTYASYGVASHNHVDSEAFAAQAGIKLTHVPYKGGAAVVQALLGGQVSFSLTGLPPTVSLIRQGKLKALAYAGSQRSAIIPDVPTVSESGLKGYESIAWFGWFVPSGTPRPVVDRIAADASRVMTTPEFRERYITGVALDPLNLGPGPFAELLKADRDVYAERLKPLNLKLE
ncbi:MAG: tripartite tricarboxylate transporter substrate binding protein [Betaproteobacteria bacterium]|nr:tripartite tricarboxylate transporter substrate binding protein [Betaproteobacteria bacterium]